MPKTSQEIETQAAEWVAKRELGSLSPEDETHFEAWLATDTRALGAYCRIEGTLLRVERVGGLANDDEHGLDIPKEASDTIGVPRMERRRVMMMGGMAAGIAAVFVAGATVWGKRHNNIYATDIGVVREFSLSDGSVITLNTDSKVLVKYTERMREVHLVRGEALFDVAKNKSRPFVVSAGSAQVRAVGTSFAVSILPQQPTQVIVREGVVEVKAAGANPNSAVRAKANSRVLVPNGNGLVSVSVAQARVARDLAWQYGQIAFDSATLRDAANEFRRYSNIRIVVDDSVANRTVTGLFSSNDPIGFARVTAAVLELQVEVSEKEVRLFGRSQKNEL
jgi:transmembrane sensor